MRDDEDRARGLGVPAGTVKLAAFVISAVPIGMCGAVYAYFLGQIFPQFAFNPLFDLSVALMALFGGIGTLAGPLLGALVLESLQQYFTIQFTNEDLYLVIYGALFLVVLLWMPRGVIPTVVGIFRRRSARHAAGARAAVRAAGASRAGGDRGSTVSDGRGRGRPCWFEAEVLKRGVRVALLEVEGVNKRYGGIQALDGCHLVVGRGEIAGLIGPNGSGKTTLFNVITGYAKVRQGTVLLDGKDITNLLPDRIFNRGVGRTFQLTRVFGRLTVMENMLVASQHRRSWWATAWRRSGSHGERTRAMELLEFVGIARLAGEEAANLSYGQRKLLELAYVLMSDPEVLLLDEPAGGVNLTLLNAISDHIKELNRQGRTFLVVEHNMEFVMGLCHRVTVMDHGSIVMAGLPEQVRDDPRVLDAYLGAADDEDDPRKSEDRAFHRRTRPNQRSRYRPPRSSAVENRRCRSGVRRGRRAPGG